MARQREKLSDKFKEGGDKDGSPEEKFFTDEDIQMDPEWKVIELLKSQIDSVTDVVNANDAASGSYADLKKEYVISSGSFSTRATTASAGSGSFAADIKTLTIASGSFSTRSTANDAKASYDKDLSDTSAKVVKMTVTENRGAYALEFTMTHGRNTKTATIALS